MLKCDIIIPVYNAFDCLEECIESVLRMTDFSKAHLFLIDDKSPDERVLPLLKKYGKKYKDKITVLENETNLGFVKTVNKGMMNSDNDVLLLNSDTVVTKRWLEKIQNCAYIDEYVATVTPLSNNATLASVPVMFRNNRLPEGYSLEEMADLVEECSLKLYPEIPTAHGFCMYIKRDVLNKVGFFDEENFGKGYGEENDFSFRCFKYGYRHLLCDDTYILHKESQSFLDKKIMHDKEMEELHPIEKKKLDIWNQSRVIEKVGKNIEFALGKNKNKKNVLFVIHDFDLKNLGGTTMHAMDLITELRKEYNVHVLYPKEGNYIVHSYYQKTDVVTAMYERVFTIEQIQFYSLEYKQMLERIITNYGISYVHIHHLMGHCFSVIDACKHMSVKYAVTLHDYYLIEAEVGVIEKEVGSKDNEFIDLKEWRKNSKRLLELASKVFAPSNYVKNVFQDYYGLKNIDVIEHGVGLKKNKKTWKLGDAWNIAFIGVMCPHKGIEILDGLVDGAPKNMKIHLFGVLPPDRNYNGRFVNHGQYTRGELPQLFKNNKIDLACVFSLWPETYSYTATEAIASGVPVVAFDLGAIHERIKRDRIGFSIQYTRDGSVVLKKIEEILNNQEEYEKVECAIDKYKLKTIEDMGKEYRDIYDTYSREKDVKSGLIRENMLLANRLLNNGGFSDKYKLAYFELLNSRRWKMVSKIRIPDNVRKVVKILKGKKCQQKK